MYVGSTCHADDLRSTTSNTYDLHFQASTILNFTRNNFLKLNSSKCELLISSMSPNDVKFPLDLKPSNACRCLGFWWTPTLSPKVSIDPNIANAKKCLFSIGAKGLFQGNLNSLSGKAILNACVIPTCLSGCENWILNDPPWKHSKDMLAVEFWGYQNFTHTWYHWLLYS